MKATFSAVLSECCVNNSCMDIGLNPQDEKRKPKCQAT